MWVLGGPFRPLWTNSANFKRADANEPQKTPARAEEGFNTEPKSY